MSWKIDFDLNGLDPEFGSWLAGLIDGEGCFIASQLWNIRKDGERVPCLRILLTITLRLDDSEVLEFIHDTLGIGNLYPTRYPGSSGKSKPTQRYWVQSIKEIRWVIVPILDRFPLRSKKAEHYKIWRKIALEHYEQCTTRPGYKGKGKGRRGRQRYFSNYWDKFKPLLEQLHAIKKYDSSLEQIYFPVTD